MENSLPRDIPAKLIDDWLQRASLKAREGDATLLDLYLNTDLSHSSLAVLPEACIRMHNAVIAGPLVLQIDELVNIGASANMEQGDPTANRLLKLALTDGHQAAFAYEHQFVPALSLTDTRAGCKIVIRNINVRRGMMQLTPDTCFVLGGAVPLLRDLQAARDQQVARREAAATQARAATATASSSAAPVATTTTTAGVRSTSAIDTVSRVPSAPQSTGTTAAARGGRGSGSTINASASDTRVVPNNDPTRRRPGNSTTGADDGSTPHSAGTEAQVQALFSSQQSDDSVAVVSPPPPSSAQSGSAHRQGATDVDGDSDYGELDPDDVLRATMQLERRPTHPTPASRTTRRRSTASETGAGVIDLVNTVVEHVDSMEIDDDDLLEIDTTPVLPAGQRPGGSQGSGSRGRGMDGAIVLKANDALRSPVFPSLAAAIDQLRTSCLRATHTHFVYFRVNTRFESYAGAFSSAESYNSQGNFRVGNRTQQCTVPRAFSESVIGFSVEEFKRRTSKEFVPSRSERTAAKQFVRGRLEQYHEVDGEFVFEVRVPKGATDPAELAMRPGVWSVVGHKFNSIDNEPFLPDELLV